MKITKGNFNVEAKDHRGWVVGHFLEETSLLKTNDLEVKWGNHMAGECKEIMAANNIAKTLAILIRGKITFKFEDRVVTLEKEGDYCYWDNGVAHSWKVEEDCLMITVRWPSLPLDQVKI